MKRMAWTLLVAALPAAAVSAQEQGWAAKFFPNGLTHNFGNVAYGAQLSHKFPITNIYNVPFQVTEARVSCGCVTPKKPAQTIAPRGTSELEISLDTLRISPPGAKTVSIYVTLTSVPTQPNEKVFSSSCTLTVSCVARGNIVFNPGKISFGVVPAGQSPRLSLDVENAGDPNWQITGVAKHDLPLVAAVQQIQTRPGRVGFRVVVQLKPDAPAGEFRHEVQLETNDPNMPKLNVVVDGNVQAPLAAAPNAVSFNGVKANTAVLRHVVVRGPGTPFKITAVEGQGDGLTVKFDAEKASVAHVVSIQYHPTAAGDLAKELTIKTDLNGGLTAKVKVDGRAE